MKLALFDFDGTIYEKETFTLLMQHLKTTHPKRYRRFFAAILPVYIGYKVKIVQEKKMKARLMERYLQALEGFSIEQMSAYFTNVAQQMKGDFNEKVIERMQAHQHAGDYTLILSGAFTPLLHAVDLELGLASNQVIGTDIPEPNQAFAHVHAEQKVVVLQEYVKQMDIDWEASYAYGDSESDLSVLELVGHPVAVQPDAALSQIAHARDWEIIE